MNEKFIRKYMRLAKQVGEDNNPCYSRKIGVIVVDPVANKIRGTGYNGPPRGTPHCTDPEYLEKIFWPQLTNEEKVIAADAAGWDERTDSGNCMSLPVAAKDGLMCDLVCSKFANTATCPRKIVNAPSGKRLELCSCAHAETNAIVNSSDDLYGAWMFCWCDVPCNECAKLIINAGIKKIFVIEWGMAYSHGAQWMLEKAGVEIISHKAEYYLEQQ